MIMMRDEMRQIIEDVEAYTYTMPRDLQERLELVYAALALPCDICGGREPKARLVVYGLRGDEDDVKAVTSLTDLEAALSAKLLFDEERDAKHEAERAAKDAQERKFDFDCTIVCYEVLILPPEEGRHEG